MSINFSQKASTSHDLHTLIQNLYEISQKCQQLIFESLFSQHSYMSHSADPLNVKSAIFESFEKLSQHPEVFHKVKIGYLEDTLKLWDETLRRYMGENLSETISPEKEDQRFSDQAWSQNIVFNYVKQMYLIFTKWSVFTIENIPFESEEHKKKAIFHTRFWLEAISPNNFIFTNPEVIKATIESNGKNLHEGLLNLKKDIEAGNGQLQISMTDTSAFQVGENIAITPGKVIFRNELIELIHYEPSTSKQNQEPLLFIPPWINKFYILDLQQKNSFVKWVIDHGYSVFMISWVNPSKKHRHISFEDYLKLGPLAAISTIQKITGHMHLHCVGYCIGGTLLSILNAYLTKHKKDYIRSATYLASMVDFSQAGDLSVFIDEKQLKLIDKKMSEKGVFADQDMAMSFQFIRARDLIWSFVIHNYLLGKKPLAFDLLFWNSDSTSMPAKMHHDYLYNMYHENKLVVPNALRFLDTDIDLHSIQTPSFILGSKDDHITPWKAVYKAMNIYQGKNIFCLSSSGHIAGVINPPHAQKYGYWSNDIAADIDDDWLQKAKHTSGSWWPKWISWLKEQSCSKLIQAHKPGAHKEFPEVERAPGSYVKNKP